MENSEQYFSIMTNMLNYVGLNLIDERLDNRQKIRSAFCYGLFGSITFCALWSTFYYPLFSNLWLDSIIIATLLSFGMMRAIVLLYNRQDICNLLIQLQNIDFVPEIIKANSKAKEEMERLTKIVYLMGIFGRAFMCTAMSTEGVVFLYKRFFVDSSEWDIACAFPLGGFYINRSPNFEILFSYEFVSFCIVGVLLILCDMLIVALLASTTAHLKGVQHALRHPNIENIENETDPTYTYIKDVVKYHVSVINIVGTIENIFHNPMWFVIIGDVCTLCFSVCTITIGDSSLAESVNGCLCSGFVLSRVYFYCYWGSQITDQNMEIARAAAEFDWLDKSKDVKRAIIMITTRAQKPLCVTAGKVSILSLELFVNIIKASYSYLTVLKNARK